MTADPKLVTPALARRAVPVLLVMFLFSLVIDNGFKYVTGAVARDLLEGDTVTAGLQATIPGILIGIGAVVYSALSDSISIRKLSVLAIILICTGSIIGFAFQSVWPLVLTGRVIQTAGLAAAETLYVIWVTKYFTGKQQKTYLGFSTAAFQLATLLGVVGGGFIATYLAWPFLFLIAMLPLLALPVVLKTVPHEETVTSRLDVYGLFLVALIAGGVIMFLQDFQWLYLVVGIAAIVLFVMHVRRSPNAIISPAFFMNMRYTLVLVVVFIMYSVQLGYVVAFPLLMDAVHGLPEASASLLLVPGYICAVLVGVFSGLIARVLNSHQAIVLALSMATLSLLVQAFFVDAPVFVYVLTVILFPSGFALMYAPLISTAVRGIPAERSGVAIGFYNLTINMAIPIGIAYTLKLLGMDLQLMSFSASPVGAPYASVLLILGLIGLAAILLYLSVAKILHREVSATGMTPDAS